MPDSTQGGKFQKVLDGRKHPIRGLWVRNKRYYARLSITNAEDGRTEVRRISLKGATSVAEARDALNELVVRRRNSELPTLKRAPKFSDYVGTYLGRYEVIKDAKRPATIQKERYVLRVWTEHLGDTRLNHINRAMINAFIEKRQGGGASGRTVNLDVIVLRNLLRSAIDDGWIKTLPTQNLRPLKWTAKKRGLVDKSEIDRLCQVALSASKNGRQLADYVMLMAFTGARRNEALRLKWSDVDWERKQLAIGSDGLSKNRESRVVDFNSDLEAHLKQMRSRCAPDSKYLFPSPQRGAKDACAKSFVDSLKLAREEIDSCLNFHDLRHFFISMAVMSGIDYMTIARWVGHKDGGILIGKVYGHLSNDHTQRQAQRLIFSPAVVELTNEATA